MPVLLLQGRSLVKTVKFKKPKYIGDPINAVRIFNEKEVDELVFLDIEATNSRKGPNFELLSNIASEAFMPMAYGGGISSLEEIKKILYLGFEKVIINYSTFFNFEMIKEAVRVFGSSSIVGCIDVKKSVFGKYRIYTKSSSMKMHSSLSEHLDFLISLDIGEIIINSIDKDGTMSGYDLDLIKVCSENVNIPIIACGGAGNLLHFKEAIENGASAVSAGSQFIYIGPYKSVLINYPEREELSSVLP